MEAFGIEYFDFVVLEECAPDHCIEREQWWMKFLAPEYNIQPTAGSCIGVRTSEETRRKMSESAKRTFKEGRLTWNHGKRFAA